MKFPVIAIYYSPDVPPGGNWSDPKPGPDGFLTDEHPDYVGQIVFEVNNSGDAGMSGNQYRFEKGEVVLPYTYGQPKSKTNVDLGYLHSSVPEKERTPEEIAFLHRFVVEAHTIFRHGAHYSAGASLKTQEQLQDINRILSEEGQKVYRSQ